MRYLTFVPSDPYIAACIIAMMFNDDIWFGTISWTLIYLMNILTSLSRSTMTAEENNIVCDRHQVNLYLHKKGSIFERASTIDKYFVFIDLS